MITTDDDEVAERARLLRNQAKVRGNFVGDIGYNWRMTEFQAIVGLAQLRLLDKIIKKREKVAKLYDKLLEEIPEFQPLKIPKNVRHSWYKYIVFIPKGRNPLELKKHLKEKYGVSLAGFVYEVPLHSQSVFRKYVQDPSSYPIADDLCHRHIALPIYPQMTEEECTYVVECLRKSLKDLGWTK